MVDVPEDDDTPNPSRNAPVPGKAKPKTPPRKTDDEPLTGEHSQPPERRRTDPVPARPTRRTQMLSLEPPGRGPRISRDTRLDAVGGSAKERDAAMMGNIGRQKTQPVLKGPPGQKNTTKPSLRRGEEGKPVDMGGTNKRAMETMIRRRTTRRIPKEDGMGITGDNPALGGKSNREPAAPRQSAPDSLPPMVRMPVPRANIGSGRNAPPTPPNARGNTLAGVSAEELLGEEGKRLLEELRRRESEASVKPLWQQPPAKGSPLAPRMHDSSLLAFQAAEYNEEQQAPEDDELQPQGNFLSGPRRAVRGEVVQTPMAAEEGEAPPDDLGYEQPVDYGAEYNESGRDGEKRPSARVKAAHEEMEQRAGYLLWLQGVITREEIEEALESDDSVSDVARDLLQGSTFADQPTLYSFLAQHESLALADLDRIKPTERALALFGPSVARSHRVVPLERIGGILLVAAAWPFEPKRLLELRRLTGSKIKLFVVTEPEIDAALAKYYPHSSASTLRSPVPKDLVDRKAAEPVVKGGTALIKKYDPTIDGAESGLYSKGAADTRTPPGGFTIGNGDEIEFDSQAETGEYPVVDAADADEADDDTSAKPAQPDEMDPFAD